MEERGFGITPGSRSFSFREVRKRRAAVYATLERGGVAALLGLIFSVSFPDMFLGSCGTRGAECGVLGESACQALRSRPRDGEDLLQRTSLESRSPRYTPSFRTLCQQSK